MRINTQNIIVWNTAKKVKPITAINAGSIVNDSVISDKILLDTLEGHEGINLKNMICRGEAGDVWQQTPKNLFKKYNVTNVDSNGWLVCEPKPDNEVRCFQVPLGEPYEKFTIIGHYGEKIDGEDNVQSGTEGDFICQNTSDPTDVWIVKRELFNNTYKIIS